MRAQKAIGREGVADELDKEAVSRDRRWHRKPAFMLRSWNLQKSGPRLRGAAWRFKLFLMLEGLILKPLTTSLDM